MTARPNRQGKALERTVPASPARVGWQSRAECAGMSIEMFDVDAEPRLQTVALEACWSCPVRKDCLADALTFRDAGWIRGGHAVVGAESRGVVALPPRNCGYCTRLFAPARATTMHCSTEHSRHAATARRERESA